MMWRESKPVSSFTSRITESASASLMSLPPPGSAQFPESAQHSSWRNTAAYTRVPTRYPAWSASCCKLKDLPRVGEQGRPKADATCCEHVLWPVVDEADVAGPGVERVKSGEEDRRLGLDDAEAAAEKAGGERGEPGEPVKAVRQFSGSVGEDGELCAVTSGWAGGIKGGLVGASPHDRVYLLQTAGLGVGERLCEDTHPVARTVEVPAVVGGPVPPVGGPEGFATRPRLGLERLPVGSRGCEGEHLPVVAQQPFHVSSFAAGTSSQAAQDRSTRRGRSRGSGRRPRRARPPRSFFAEPAAATSDRQDIDTGTSQRASGPSRDGAVSDQHVDLLRGADHGGG